jgi:hypothetical protein
MEFAQNSLKLVCNIFEFRLLKIATAVSKKLIFLGAV